MRQVLKRHFPWLGTSKSAPDGTDLHAALEELWKEQAPGPDDEKYIEVAQGECDEGSFDFDDDPTVSRGDGGAYVACWVWVSDKDAGTTAPASMEDVAEALQGLGRPFDHAETHSSGGGVMVVRIPVGRHEYYFGTADVNWGGSLVVGDDEPNNPGVYPVEISTDLDASEPDAAVVAEAIKAALKKAGWY